jgi:glucose-6-phosphate-specific signal transduction histidine kinase
MNVSLTVHSVMAYNSAMLIYKFSKLHMFLKNVILIYSLNFQFQLLATCKNAISVLVLKQAVHILHTSFSNLQSHTEFPSPLGSNRQKTPSLKDYKPEK